MITLEKLQKLYFLYKEWVEINERYYRNREHMGDPLTPQLELKRMEFIINQLLTKENLK